jgi:hypothetical protein
MEAKITSDCSCWKHSFDQTDEECEANILNVIFLKKTTDRVLPALVNQILYY